MTFCNHPHAFRALALLILFLPIATICFIPAGRDFASAAQLNTTIWVFGGAVSDGNGGWTSSNGLYSLDISQSWPTSSPPWTDHSVGVNSSIVEGRVRSTMQVGADAASLWVYGGNVSATLFLRYNTTTGAWSTMRLQGGIPIQGCSAVRNASGTIFYFGGQTDAVNTALKWARNDAVITVDTALGVWDALPVGNGPLGRLLHTSTLVNGTMVYIIGGAVPYNASTSILAPMDNITIYDTIDGTWSWSMTTGSQTPICRSGHTAVLTDRARCCPNVGFDGNSIITFGGQNDVLNDVWTLDVKTFLWAKPTITGSVPTTGLYGKNGKNLHIFGLRTCEPQN
ncbi:hypothetical protein BC938DRAFT_482161 [Jimgerdemannia flammicorona]|uniref:Attractin/MKLN-like beta-propeller domain-containing protein n=1 Tax=Jimgerdemannia flammicorona TaxID=994334 RepID=A0A433QEM9_9FUNG|nr:hypothetical protein BC938DRAFT_482161 [Jimgerdemannia flammicorona]